MFQGSREPAQQCRSKAYFEDNQGRTGESAALLPKATAAQVCQRNCCSSRAGLCEITMLTRGAGVIYRSSNATHFISS
jgi:hypothetical protein